MGFCPFSFDSLVSLLRLRVDSSCFCHLRFLYAIALVSCTHGVSRTIQCHMISKKKKKKKQRGLNTLHNRYLPCQKFSTPHILPSLSLIGSKPHFPRFAPHLEERTPTPDCQKCPLKARRPPSTLPSLLLRVLASLDFPQCRALQPRPEQPPPPSAQTATPSLPASLTGSGWEKTPEATGVHLCTKVSSLLTTPAPFPSPCKSLPTWMRWQRTSPASSTS